MKSLSFLIFATLATAARLQAAPIEGTWVTIDDKDGSRKSLIELKINADQELTGTVIRLLQEKNQGLICEKCPGTFKNKPVEGLTIMWGLRQVDERLWREGKILDPKTGKIYKARVSLSDDGQSLNVRGFVGLSLFGRSQTWQRQSETTSAAPAI